MTVKIFSLGCRLNQYEIESVSTALKQAGMTLTDSEEEADFCVVNSCVVTGKSEAKTRNLIRRAQKSPKTIITGCFAKLLKKDGNTVYLPNDFKHWIPSLILNWDEIDSLERLKPSRFHYSPPVEASTTRVNVKIQDGCDGFCSYCIIPLVRGKPQSRDLKEILEEVKTLSDQGYQELVLTGITIGKYQCGGVDLAGLLEKILGLSGHFRLHLSSIDPNLITPALLDLLSHSRMVKHLHLSLQSGSNAVLKRMNRQYTREAYLDLVFRIRGRNALYNLTTDVITGFPSESEKDHRDTLTLIQEAEFSHVHTFRYSPRPLTPATNFENPVEESVKKARSLEIMEQSAQTGLQYLQKFHQKEGWFLGEKKTRAGISGHTDYYLPLLLKTGGEVNHLTRICYEFDGEEKILKGKTL